MFDNIATARDLLVGASAIVVAVAALWGLWAWRSEMRGRARFDHARRTVVLGLKVQELVTIARFPVTGFGETAERPRSKDEDPKVASVRDEWFAHATRVDLLRGAIREFQEVVWEASIVFDRDSAHVTSAAFATYRKRFGELSASINSYFELKRDEAAGRAHGDHRDFLDGMHRVIYEVPDDDFSQEIQAVTTELQSALKKFVS